jgi:hypothetical protein
MTKSGDAREDLIGRLRPHEWPRARVVISRHGSMAVSSSRVLRCTPRPSCLSVSVANQRSTRLTHEAPVGVKCTCYRGWRTSQFLGHQARPTLSFPPSKVCAASWSRLARSAKKCCGACGIFAALAPEQLPGPRR